MKDFKCDFKEVISNRGIPGKLERRDTDSKEIQKVVETYLLEHIG